MPGPAPKKNVRRRNARPDWVQLPAAGRKGRAPKWPLEGRAPAGWADLWKLPQAVMWEKSNSAMQVANYLLIRMTAQKALFAGEPNAALLAEMRQIEDRLGLSPMAMRRMQWEIAESDRSSGSASCGKVIDANERFRAL